MNPGDKLILFDYQIPKLVYFVRWINDTYMLIAEDFDPEKIENGWGGRSIHREVIQPFTPALWAACEKYIAKRKRVLDDLAKEHNQLKQGVVRLL
jgi:hypothetical protein